MRSMQLHANATCDDPRRQVRHKDVSAWPKDLRAMWIAHKSGVVCEFHPDCIRDETDDEILTRLRAKLASGIIFD